MSDTDEPLIVIDRLAEVSPIPEEGLGHTTALTAKDARVVVLTFSAGHVLREHAAPFPLHFQVLDGEVLLRVASEELVVRPGGLIRMAARLRHEVEAVTAARIMLTLLTAGEG